ncbi:ATP-grasp domain-containing protein [Lederbergia citrea]|uniref:ATP-grasp domain-containing protein n=1 Tax=Lederbergia citrea TaxID=2833581 RepID=UPI001BCA2681|nr:ATP-grasp domain-containing protein [Lederbergia citrea]MBS4179130.1 ATP-grasp domain-containing protein [Lederbergia citrea]
MNILICSAGRRVKLVQYFKEELHKINGKVIAVDCDFTAPALYHADIFEVVPRINRPNYIDHIMELCDKYKVNGILSLIDPELSLLANFKEEFERKNISVIVSDKEIVDMCYDKYLTSQWLLENNIPSVPTYINIDKVLKDIRNKKIDFPLIVKPKNGSASLGINKVNSIKKLEFFRNEAQDWVVQPFIVGEEFGVDCYIDLITQKPTNIFMKRKINMRAGETDKSIATRDEILKKLIEKLILTLKPIGPIDIDCFKTENGYMISEINPRFGGGYLHAHEMGQSFVRNIINNLLGESNEQNLGDYKEGSTMVKYDHYIVI